MELHELNEYFWELYGKDECDEINKAIDVQRLARIVKDGGEKAGRRYEFENAFDEYSCDDIEDKIKMDEFIEKYGQDVWEIGLKNKMDEAEGNGQDDLWDNF